ncbi:MAG: DUF3943 domain-containing protein [Campylobacterales bacterium]|nr:DUF3943 domain-containing protein [Campylobacterales bacterium]
MISRGGVMGKKTAGWLFLLASYAWGADPLYEHLKTAVPDQAPERAVEGLPLATPLPMPGRDDYIPSHIIVNETIPQRYETVVEDTLYLQLVLLSSIGVLSLMPESVTGWNEEELAAKSLESRWKENVSKRPVWDKDDAFINYVGHPVSGAWYYTMARNDGMSITESAVFSALMSTFFWEYGYEAFAEVPSIQDLIVTPLAGALLGEWFYVLERRVDANGGLVLGSRVIGNISYFFLDPLGRIADGIRRALGVAGIRPHVTMTLRTYPRAHGGMASIRSGEEEAMRPVLGDYGFIITFQ